VILRLSCAEIGEKFCLGGGVVEEMDEGSCRQEVRGVGNIPEVEETCVEGRRED
jgi:hypothetical protein